MPGGPSVIALTDEVSAELCRLVGDAGLNEKDACTLVGIIAADTHQLEKSRRRRQDRQIL